MNLQQPVTTGPLSASRTIVLDSALHPVLGSAYTGVNNVQGIVLDIAFYSRGTTITGLRNVLNIVIDSALCLR